MVTEYQQELTDEKKATPPTKDFFEKLPTSELGCAFLIKAMSFQPNQRGTAAQLGMDDFSPDRPSVTSRDGNEEIVALEEEIMTLEAERDEIQNEFDQATKWALDMKLKKKEKELTKKYIDRLCQQGSTSGDV
ncbi:hypothetical protein BGW39_007804 [Mortierella sp. 14UC]|nr:hypothetical protein BGW39_007804 [Mortierella sp. 14UC]